MGFGRPPSVVDIAIFGVLYVTAAYGTRRVFWLGFASAIVGALVITVYLFLGRRSRSGGLTLRTIPTALAVLVAAAFALLLAWTIGALVRTALRARENREAQERAEAEAVVEQERVRIARDMHDVVAHSLAVVIAQADGARYARRGCRIPRRRAHRRARHDLDDRALGARRRPPAAHAAAPQPGRRAAADARRPRGALRAGARGRRRSAGRRRPRAAAASRPRGCSSRSTGSCRRR